MTKKEQIEAKKLKPFEVGDNVIFKIPFKKKVTETKKEGRKKIHEEKLIDDCFKNTGFIYKIENDIIHIKISNISIPFELREEVPSYYPRQYVNVIKVKKEFVSPTFNECGSNPFSKEKRRIDFYNQDIESILFKCGYNIGNDKSPSKFRENKINFNPYIIDKDGNKQYYQRDLVWNIGEKQLLIESIYKGIEIGKFLFRYNSWARLLSVEKETGNQYSHDCVDGKQRCFTLLEFIQNKFPDSHGNYWDDLSEDAQRRFFSFSNLSYGELKEDATDEDVIDNFLSLNFSGVPMSQEHIDYVSKFKL